MRFRATLDGAAVSSILDETVIRRVSASFVILFAACVAALAAHIIIDLLGDVVLVRDAYDYESHASRTVALGGAACGGLAVAWRIVASIFAQAINMNRRVPTAAVANIIAGSAWWFVARVTIVTVLIVAAMGALDASFVSLRGYSVIDAFGGSLAFGLCVCIPLGIGVGSATLSILRWIAASHGTLVAAVIALLCRHVRGDRSITASRPHDQAFSRHRSLSALVRLAGKRAPPPLRA